MAKWARFLSGYAVFGWGGKIIVSFLGVERRPPLNSPVALCFTAGYGTMPVVFGKETPGQSDI
jgi:hypothetical protein